MFNSVAVSNIITQFCLDIHKHIYEYFIKLLSIFRRWLYYGYMLYPSLFIEYCIWFISRI